jgi:SAM-dependent methyltransferase
MLGASEGPSSSEDPRKAATGLSEGSSRRRADRPFEALPDGLSCPSCRAAVNGNGREARCSGCGRTVVVHGGRLPDFLAAARPVADVILGWSDDFILRVEPSLRALASGEPVGAAAWEQLEANHLLHRRAPTGAKLVPTKSWRLDQGSPLTSLGNNLAYHCVEFYLQSATNHSGGFLKRLEQLTSLGAEARVLDVGCGAGQTLRLLGRSQPAERIGLDIDLEALAFGCRLAESHGESIRFVRGSAYRIPFRDDRFSHVICRIALNYVHQRRALREMVRVLRPGGFLYCSLEGLGFDLQFLSQARTAAQVLCRLRDLFYGLTLALIAVQPAPGSRLTGGRAFGTLRRSGRFLSHTGCDVVHAEATTRYWGLPVLVELTARKRSK